VRHDSQSGCRESRIARQVEFERLAGLDGSRLFQVVVHVVSPQIVLLVCQHEAHPGQVEQPPWRDLPQLLAHPAVRKSLIGGEKQGLKLVIILSGEQSTVIAVDSGQLQAQ